MKKQCDYFISGVSTKQVCAYTLFNYCVQYFYINLWNVVETWLKVCC